MCETGHDPVRTQLDAPSPGRADARTAPCPTPMSQFAARSFRSPSPYGNVLIMSPWNYPLLLTLDPLIGRHRRGQHRHGQAQRLLLPPPRRGHPEADRRVLSPRSMWLSSPAAGRRTQALLDQKFDKIFFTGGQTVGREVLRQRGRAPDPRHPGAGRQEPLHRGRAPPTSALAARRIVFGKYLNCGQTCVAPDYILLRRIRQGRAGQRPSRRRSPPSSAPIPCRTRTTARSSTRNILTVSSA